MSSSKFARFTFRGKRHIEHKVGGEEFRFYPNRMALLEEARDLSAPIAKSISVLFVDETKDTKSAVKRHQEGEGKEGFFMEDITTEAISTEMAAHRQAERDKAIETILESLDARSVILLGKLFMDSLRDEFPYRKQRSACDVEAFLYGEEAEEGEDGEEPAYTGLDMPVLIQLFSGWMKANAKVFGELGEKVAGLVRGRLEQLQGDSSLETTIPASGSSSKTLTSPRLVTDSEPTS